MLEGCFRSVSDECPATTLAELEVACLEHEDAKTCVRLRNVKANIAFDVRQRVIERHRLAPSNEIDDIVRQIVDVGVALTKDAGTKQRAKRDSIDAASPGDGRQPRLRRHSELIVCSLGEEILNCLP